MEKWGNESLKLGWTALPTALLILQGKLGISPLGLNILLNLVSLWWDVSEQPYPSQQTLANRIGVSKRSIQRESLSLIKAGLLKTRRSTYQDEKLHGRNAYDLKPLVEKLQELSPNLAKAMKKNKEDMEEK